MTEKQVTEQIREDILDKAKFLCAQQLHCRILTRPSAKYPRGGKFQGYIFDVKNNVIKIDDTFDKERHEIYLSEIISPADLFEVEKHG